MRKNEIEIDGEIYIRKVCTEQVTGAGMPYVLTRTYSAGVFAGFLQKREGREVTLVEARRLWRWEGSASLSQLAMEGVKKPGICKFPCVVNEILLLEAIEIIPCTKTAKNSIEGVPVWAK